MTTMLYHLPFDIEGFLAAYEREMAQIKAETQATLDLPALLAQLEADAAAAATAKTPDADILALLRDLGLIA